MTMKKFSKHTPEQIVRKLDRAREMREAGSTTAQIVTELGISEATLNRWQSTYGSMTRSEAKSFSACVMRTRGSSDCSVRQSWKRRRGRNCRRETSKPSSPP